MNFEEEIKQHKKEREVKCLQKEKEKSRNVHHKRERITTPQKSVKACVVASDPEDDDDIITCPVCHERGCSDALRVCCGCQSVIPG